MIENNNKEETKIDVQIEGDDVKFIISTTKQLLEEEEESAGVRTCCRIYDQDHELLQCVGIHEPYRILADFKCALKVKSSGGSRGYNSKGRCGDFPECDKV